MADHRVKLAVAALTLVFGLGALPGAAEAQFFGNWGGWDHGGTWDGMAPQQVRRAIAEHGFRVTAPLRRNGNVFVADVIDGRGRHERLIVAAADAQILQRFLIDDGRQPGALPRDGAVAGLGTDDSDGLVPPVDIPNAGRHSGRPIDGAAPPQRLGNLGTDEGDSDLASPILPTPTLRKVMPPIKTVRPPRPHVADRTSDVAAPGREPGAVESTPLAPPSPRPVVPATATLPVVKAPPASVVASRPEPAVAARPPQPAPAAPESPPRRTTDPLAIPGSADRGSQPVRSVSGAVTGAPAPLPPGPPNVGDVPVAPLD